MIPDGVASAYSTSSISERTIECTSNCASYQPTYTPVPIVSPTDPESLGGSIIDLGGGGRAVAWIDVPNGASLHYTECAGDCADGGAWVDVVVDSSNAASAPPEMAISASGVRGIAFPGNGHLSRTVGPLYAECAGDCTLASNWAETNPEGRSGPNNPRGRLGLALRDQPGGGLLRMLTDGRSYVECSSNCTPGILPNNTWPLTGAPRTRPRAHDQVLLVGAQGLPRLAIVSCSQVEVEDCLQAPCTTSANWSATTLSVNSNCNGGELGFAVDAQGLGRVIYQIATTLPTIGLATEIITDGGTSPSWTTSTLATCGGASLGGTFPSLGLTSYGGLRIHYGYSGWADGGVGHAVYAFGP